MNKNLFYQIKYKYIMKKFIYFLKFFGFFYTEKLRN